MLSLWYGLASDALPRLGSQSRMSHMKEETSFHSSDPPESNSTGMKHDGSSFAMTEVYQTQRYYPLAGWSKNGRKQYCTQSGVLFDSLPDEEILPDGWKVLCIHHIFHNHCHLSAISIRTSLIPSFTFTTCISFSGQMTGR